MADVVLSPPSTTCRRCGTQLAPRLLACPSCGALAHAGALSELVANAEAAERAGVTTDALTMYREALALLPESAPQHAVIAARVDALSKGVDSASREGERSLRARFAGKGAIIATAALAIWKFKFIVVFLLTKGKLLLLGLTKASTLFSMLLSLGVYWAAWGWRFALGLIVSMYVHEMGHVAALRRYGIAASAPMFIPGLGALVRLKQSPRNEREDAQVGLAGPLWGLWAVVAALAVWAVTGGAFWGATARTAAWLNLFNLMPIWQLDGGRGFRAMSRVHRGIATATLLLAWLVVKDGMLLLLLVVAATRLFTAPSVEPDRRAVALYVFLVIALSAVLAVPMTLPLTR